MQTKLTELLGIQYPVIQGAMAWVSDAKLAGAVSEAGGLGVIASGGRSPQWLREEIKKTRRMTEKPFAVNLVLQDEDWPEKLEVILEERPACVTTGAGNPLPLIEPLHAAGIKIIPVVPNIRLAKRVEAAGADAIIIEGMEAGGHIGKVSTMALMTQVLPQISIPGIVAGGIADGRGLAAALLMGASGVQMGTRFYASSECSAHPNAKNAIIQASENDSETTGRRDSQVRGLKNVLSIHYYELKDAGASEDELSQLVRGSAQRAPLEGDIDWGMVQAGQSLSVIDEILPVQTIIDRVMLEAKEAYDLARQFFSE